jgi:hypothetical protein
LKDDSRPELPVDKFDEVFELKIFGNNGSQALITPQCIQLKLAKLPDVMSQDVKKYKLMEKSNFNG